MARKTREDTLKTIEDILDAAEVVFMKHGIAKATMAQIAAGADVSKGAVYGHFKDKLDVCVAVCRRGVAMQQSIGRIEPGETNLQTLLRWGMEQMSLYFSSESFRNVGAILYTMCENSPEFEPIHRIRTLLQRRAFRATHRLLEQAKNAGELAPDVDPNVANITAHAIIDGLICARFYGKRLPADDPMPVVEKVLERALASLSMQPAHNKPS